MQNEDIGSSKEVFEEADTTYEKGINGYVADEAEESLNILVFNILL